MSPGKKYFNNIVCFTIEQQRGIAIAQKKLPKISRNTNEIFIFLLLN